MDCNGLQSYYLFIPLSSLIPGALALNQWSRGLGQSDALLCECFCAAATRRAGRKSNNRVISRLTVTIMPNETGKPIGFLYTLYENDRAMNDLVEKMRMEDEKAEAQDEEEDEAEEGPRRRPKKKKMDLELRIAAYDFPEYLDQLANSNPPHFYLHLKRLIDTKAKEDWKYNWPFIMGGGDPSGPLSGSRYKLQTAILQYLSKTFATDDHVQPTFRDSNHPFHPSNVFTLENALKRLRRGQPSLFDPTKDDPVRGTKGVHFDTVAAFLDANPLDEFLAPFWPEYTFAISDRLLIPATMRCFCMPVRFNLELLQDEFKTSAYRRFHQEYTYAGNTVDEATLQRIYLSNMAHQTLPAYSSFKVFFERYQSLYASGATKERLFDAASRDLAALLHPEIEEGQSVKALVDFADKFLEENDGHFSMHISPLSESIRLKLDPIADRLAIIMQWMSRAFHVADVQPVIMAVGLMAQSAFMRGSDKEMLQPILALTGPAGTGKSFSMLAGTAIFLVRQAVHSSTNESKLAHTADDIQRWFVEVYDEMTLKQLGVDEKMARDDFGQMCAILNRTSMSLSEEAHNMIREATNPEHTSRHLVIDPTTGKRKVIKTTTIRDGIKIGGTNVPLGLMGNALADRTISKECPVFQGNGALDQVVSMMLRADPAYLRSQKQELVLNNQRTHYLLWLYSLFVTAKALPPVDTSAFAAMERVVVDELCRMGVTGSGTPRKLFKVLPLAKVLAFHRAIDICFDRGIGGPDLGRPFDHRDLEKMAPLLVITRQCTVLAMEMCPVFIPESMLAVMQGLRSLFYYREPGKNFDSLRPEVDASHKDGYLRLHKGLAFVPRNGVDSLAAKVALTNHLTTKLKNECHVSYERVEVYCALAAFLTNIVATVDRDGKIENKPAWRIDGMTEKGGELIIHESILHSHDLTRDHMFRAICNTLHPDTPARTVMRAIQHPRDRDRFILDELHPVHPESERMAMDKYRADHAAWVDAQAECAKNRDKEEENLRKTRLYSEEQIMERILWQKAHDEEMFPEPREPKRDRERWQFPDANYIPPETKKRLREGHFGALDVSAFENDNQSGTAVASITPRMDEDLVERRLADLKIADPAQTHFARPENLERCIEAHARAAWAVDTMLSQPSLLQALRVLWYWCRMLVIYDQHQALCEPPSELHLIRRLAKAGLPNPSWGQTLYKAYYHKVRAHRAMPLQAVKEELDRLLSLPDLAQIPLDWQQLAAPLVVLQQAQPPALEIAVLPPAPGAAPRVSSSNMEVSASASAVEPRLEQTFDQMDLDSPLGEHHVPLLML